MKTNGYLVTVTEVKSYVSTKAPIADSNYCVIKDTTGGYTGPGVINNFYVNETVSPFSTYANNREPRYQDIVPYCPSCVFATSLNTVWNCSGGYADGRIAVNSSCGSYQVRMVAVGNGAVTTAWSVTYCCSGGPVFFDFHVHTGTYYTEIRSVIPTGTCPAQSSTNYNICCDTNPNWVNDGFTFCAGTSNCNLYQPQRDDNFCSATYNDTRYVDLGTNDGCGTWSAPTNYCVNYGVYPFQLRSRETNSCTGNTRNDTFVADLSPTCGYSCSYWGLSVSYNSQYCADTTNTSGVVTINANANNGSFQVRLVSVGSGVTTAWQTGTTFTGVTDGQYYAEIRSTSDNGCTASTGYPYIFVSCYVAPTTTTTTSTTTCTPTRYYALNSCSGGATAYTTITPGGTNQTYIIPYPSSQYYTYGGSYTDSCTPPSGYNSSIQIVSNVYGCPI